MKNITKYILAAAAAFSSLTACQEFEDFDKTIDGTPGLVYVQTGTENLYTIRVVHKPTGSTGEFFTEFPVRCNTTRHAGVKATFVYDASLVESYNAEHKTSYAALPAEYLTLENTTLTVPENATASADSVKVTLTGNLSLLTERNYLAPLRIKAEGIDAVIASDFAAILYARRIGVEVHISTQSNISNSEAVKFFSQWADTVVLARELTLEQVARIHREIAENDIRGPRGELVQLEMFAHGALCMSVSGKCYLSLYETNCSANRGACRQLCRRKYTVTDKETGAALDVDGRYVLSPKDLCTVDFLDKFIGAGVRVLKIEGRARGAEYVKRVVECYDEALRAIEAGTYTPELAAGLKERLATVFNRGFWEGYYAGRPVAEHSEHYGSAATRRKVYVGKVTNFYKRISVAEVLVEAAPLAVGEEIFFMGATTGVAEQTLAELHDTDGKPVPSVAQGTLCAVRTQGTIRRGDQLYKFVDAQ